MSANETPAPDLIGAARGALGEECLQDAKCDIASKLEPAAAGRVAYSQVVYWVLGASESTERR